MVGLGLSVVKAAVDFIYKNGTERGKYLLKHVSRNLGLLDSGEERRGDLMQVQSPGCTVVGRCIE